MNFYDSSAYSISIIQPSKLNFNRIVSFLKNVDLSFYEPLSERIIIEDYAQKLSQRAVNIFITDSLIDIAHAAFYISEREFKIFLSSIAVIDDYKNRGVGSFLLSSVENYAIKNQFSKIELEVDSRSNKLKEFYKKNGYNQYHSINNNELKVIKLMKAL